MWLVMVLAARPSQREITLISWFKTMTLFSVSPCLSLQCRALSLESQRWEYTDEDCNSKASSSSDIWLFKLAFLKGEIQIPGFWCQWAANVKIIGTSTVKNYQHTHTGSVLGLSPLQGGLSSTAVAVGWQVARFCFPSSAVVPGLRFSRESNDHSPLNTIVHL